MYLYWYSFKRKITFKTYSNENINQSITIISYWCLLCLIKIMETYSLSSIIIAILIHVIAIIGILYYTFKEINNLKKKK